MTPLPDGSIPPASSLPPAVLHTHRLRLRVRYSETDQMGTVYNSRPLEWFECGRTELLRDWGLPYTELEARGVFLPLVEAGVKYHGRARYDDLLEITSTLTWEGRARWRVEARVIKVEDGAPVVSGHTLHVFTNAAGRPIRPPEWILARCPTRRDQPPAA